MANGRTRAHGIIMTTSLLMAANSAAAPMADRDLLAMSLEELGEVQVTTASRNVGTLSTVPASVFVIHGDELRAHGIRTLPEALRLAPNLHVARVNARQYAISARGFTTTLSNKLLVMIDGRPIYTPLFAGVLWDAQDILIDDIERIEVISGPGAAAWGSNAVNGVISIITRPARHEGENLLLASLGGDAHGAGWRQQMTVGDTAALRVYAKHSHTHASDAEAGGLVDDGWEQAQAGFRSDWQSGDDTLRLQGDVFRAQAAPRSSGQLRVGGFNLLGEWQRPTAAGGELRAQAYVDVMDREDPLVFLDRMEIAAVELQHRFEAGAHRVAWGGGYRHARDRSSRGLLARLLPDDRTLQWGHLFIEDTINLTDRFSVNAGARLESNVYTGVEFLPSLRFSWQASDDALLWGAVSRAVRSPARIDRDFRFPAQAPFVIRGGPDFASEVSNVAELGFRAQPGESLYLSLTAFHHWHDRLRSGLPTADGAFIINDAGGRTYGIEGWATWRAASHWDIGVGFVELRQRLEPGRLDPAGVRDQGNDPEHQAQLKATWRIDERQSMALLYRHVGALPNPTVPSWQSLDLRWSFSPIDAIEIGVGLRNVLNDEHAEFGPAAGQRRSVFGRTALLDLAARW